MSSINRYHWLGLVLVTGLACSSSSNGGGGGSGGTSDGGSNGTAGNSSGGSGGSKATGGSSATGGATATGGTSATGGASATGGTKATGGSSATGGAGGTSSTGGTGGTANASTEMSFFVTSTPPSGSGDLKGLAGADAHCKKLAMDANAVRKVWVAYLSVANGGNGQPVHAKDRIGAGPWYNAEKKVFAANQAALHGLPDPAAGRDAYIAVKPADALFKTEKNTLVPNAQHDILTGCKADGTLMAGKTCNDWTSSGAVNGAGAGVGHSDIPPSTEYSPSWNAAHESANCSVDGVKQRGGNGRIYCFATD